MKKLLTACLLLTTSLFAFSNQSYMNTNYCDKIIANPYFKVCYDYHLMGAKTIAYTLDGNNVNKINIKNDRVFILKSR